MNNHTKSNALWITQTAIMIALIVVIQATTSGLGQFVTGSLVNLILILTVALAGFTSGLTVACLSPIFAFIFGISVSPNYRLHHGGQCRIGHCLVAHLREKRPHAVPPSGSSGPCRSPLEIYHPLAFSRQNRRPSSQQYPGTC